jgi:apolipoprotein N-acyltransferase
MDATSQHIAGGICRAIVNDNHFIRATQHGAIDFVEQKSEIVGLIAAGDDHRNRWCCQAELPSFLAHLP